MAFLSLPSNYLDSANNYYYNPTSVEKVPSQTYLEDGVVDAVKSLNDTSGVKHYPNW